MGITKFLIVFFSLFYSSFLLAIPMPPEDLPWWGNIIKNLLGNFPEVNGWFAAMMVGILGLLRGVAEFLGFIARKTESPTDDKIVEMLHVVSAWLAKIIGWFGLGNGVKK